MNARFVSSLDRLRTRASLLRWLGPWTGSDTSPEHPTRYAETLDGVGRPLFCARYEPGERVRGVYVVVQGLHYDGPDDLRMDRFCRILAASGFVVVAPFLHDYARLTVAHSAAEETAIAFQHAEHIAMDRGLARPALFSISFGCSPALAVASRFGRRVSGLVLFGGYADFEATIRFAVTKRARHQQKPVAVPHDPLNVPAVFINLVELIDAPGSADALRNAWLTMARRTWGRIDTHPVARRRGIAESIAATLEPAQRELFLIGCGLSDGAEELLEAAFARAGDHFAFADPRPDLARLCTPVVIAHGRDDDVIPWPEAHKIQAALPPQLPQRLLITGIYGHTGATLPSARSLAVELRTMLNVVGAMADAPVGRL